MERAFTMNGKEEKCMRRFVFIRKPKRKIYLRYLYVDEGILISLILKSGIGGYRLD
jgi:hypothetical protein